jgi:hypothetical protein
MAKIWSDAQGNLLRLVQTPQEEAAYGAPAGAAFVCDFDPATNPTLASALQGNWSGVALPANNAPQIGGAAYAVVAPGADYQARQLVQALIPAFRQGTLPAQSTVQAAISAVQGGTATSAQQQVVLTLLMRVQALTLAKLLASGAI